MGRYSTVQAYADSNANMRSVSYQQATGSADVKKGSVKTEKVVNPYGSTAGAGSGEFHVYRHARSREMQRLKEIDKEEKEAKMEQEFKELVDKNKTDEELRTEKRRKKRQREKEAKLRRKNLKLSGVDLDDPKDSQKADADIQEEEFTYTTSTSQQPSKTDRADAKVHAFANDGSFLAMMKKKLAEEESHNENISNTKPLSATQNQENEETQKNEAPH